MKSGVIERDVKTTLDADAGSHGRGTTAGIARFSAITPQLALGLLMVAALIYWLWFGLAVRNIEHDDGISIMAAQAILEHGYQLLPSGYIYTRGYVAHYMLAAALKLFGLNSFAIMLPSLLMGLGSLFLVYRLAERILRRPWLGVGAVLLLIILSIQTWYATGPRMYMAVQFFTLLGMYAVWRGYVEDQRRYRWLALASITAAIFSADQGVVFAVVFPVCTAVVLRLRGHPWPHIFSKSNIIGTLYLAGLAGFVALYEVPGRMPLVIGHAGVSPDRVGLSLNPINWGRHILHLERTIPYSLAFFLVAYLDFFKSLRSRLDPEYRLTYLVLVFTCAFLTIVALVKTGGHRVHFPLAPMYALLVCGGVVATARLLFGRARAGRRTRLAIVGLLMTGVLISIALATLKQLKFRDVREGRESLQSYMLRSWERGLNLRRLVVQGYGIPCTTVRECDPVLRTDYRNLREAIQPGDLVLSRRPMEGRYYLGRIDGFVFIPKEERRYPTLERSPTDEYFGTRIIDTVAELQDLRASDRRVWLIIPPRDEWEINELSEAMLQTLEREFTLYHDAAYFAVYTR